MPKLHNSLGKKNSASFKDNITTTNIQQSKLFKNPEYQERFFNVSLHGLERFYGHPDDVENIIRDMKTIYISMVQELRKNS